MKKFYLGMLAIMLTFFTSCQFSENIYIDEVHEVNHDPLMIAHQTGVQLLILVGQQTNY